MASCVFSVGEGLKHYYYALLDKPITELSDSDVDLLLKIITGVWDPCDTPNHRKSLLKEKVVGVRSHG